MTSTDTHTILLITGDDRDIKVPPHVRRVPFTFEGLSSIMDEVHDFRHVIVDPDKSLFRSTPDENDLRRLIVAPTHIAADACTPTCFRSPFHHYVPNLSISSELSRKRKKGETPEDLDSRQQQRITEIIGDIVDQWHSDAEPASTSPLHYPGRPPPSNAEKCFLFVATVLSRAFAEAPKHRHLYFLYPGEADHDVVAFYKLLFPGIDAYIDRHTGLFIGNNRCIRDVLAQTLPYSCVFVETEDYKYGREPLIAPAEWRTPCCSLPRKNRRARRNAERLRERMVKREGGRLHLESKRRRKR